MTRRRVVPGVVVVAEVEHLLPSGEAPTQIARTLGMDPAAVARALYRAHRADLARRFERLRERPPHPCADGCGTDVSYDAVRCRPCHARRRHREGGAFAPWPSTHTTTQEIA